MADDNWWASSPFATAASAQASTSTGGRAKTTPQDMQILRDSTGLAETERDARRQYAATRRAVLAMNTGPMKASFLDSITPDENGTPVLDQIGAVAGSVARPFISGSTWDARDQLNTVSAQVALAGSKQMKGSSSDKDTALMRMAGVSPYKRPAENLRILDEAEEQGAFAQHRATLKSKWISRFGSVAAPGPHGLSFEEAATRQDALVRRALDIRKQGLPAPPKSVTRRTSTAPIEVDINGNPIR